MDLRAFAFETASESPAPGGGSIAAYSGALGIALGTMVANLSANKRGWEEQLDFHSGLAQKGQDILADLLKAVDEDTAAFNAIMNAFSLPKDTDEEKQARKKAVQEATKLACMIPLGVMKTAAGAMDVLEAMVEKGNPNSITDAGVGALCIRTAVHGAFMNVKINAGGLEDKTYVKQLMTEAEQVFASTEDRVSKLVLKVEDKIRVAF
jgi:glutamate formiminotransferase/formiminotetrahydrofolate cyclodeaminase